MPYDSRPLQGIPCIRLSSIRQTEDQEMHREKVPAKQFTSWSWCIIGAAMLMVLPACAQSNRRTSQTKGMSPQQITSDLISIRPLDAWSGEPVPRGPQVSIVGDQIHIETFGPAVIEIKPFQEAPIGKSQPGQPGDKAQASRGPIIIAPTP
jgi:hypothetical protein